MNSASVQQSWKKELKDPSSEDTDYIAEKDISRRDKTIGNLVLSLQHIQGLGDSRDCYTVEQKLKAVAAYYVTGRIDEAAKITGIEASTIRKWKQVTPWWNEAVREVKRAKQEQLDVKLTNLIEKSMSELRDRLLHGDEVVTSKGQKLRRKISGRDLAIITGCLYDKRTQIRKDPLSDKEEVKEDTLNKLKANFEQLSKEIQARTIEGTHTTDGPRKP